MNVRKFSFVGLMCFLSALPALADNLAGVPVSESAPTSCTTVSFASPQTSSFTVQTSGNPWPAPASCTNGPCLDYAYTISAKDLSNGPNIDHTVFAVSASQALAMTSPSAYVTSPGSGDGTTGFLAGTRHEYPVRFNSSNSKSVTAHIYIYRPSAPRISTVLIRSGTKLAESCLIAGPGVGSSSDVFQPVTSSQTTTVAGGKCIATLIFDSAGNLFDVTAVNAPGAPGDTDCQVRSPDTDHPLLINGKPLRNNTSPFGITYGDGTTTCYGPPIPSIPKCICTKSPCP
jgi:hypothetical protein